MFKEEKVNHTSLCQQNELLLDESIIGIEREDYLKMLDGFPNLLANSYSLVCQVTLVEHKIDLKPQSKPMVQRLRQLGVVQADVVKKEVTNVLQAGFIFPVENLEWISHVVVTP